MIIILLSVFTVGFFGTAVLLEFVKLIYQRKNLKNNV